MNVKVQNVGKNVVQLEIEVGSEVFEQGMKKSYNKNVGSIAIPGFRKGKAPRNIIERHYGESVFYEDAINFVCSEVYDSAVKEANIYPVDRPDIDVKQIGNNQNFIFTATVTVKPEVELGEYKNIEVAKVEKCLTDEDLENEIKKVAENNSRMITVEDGEIQLGDIVDINFDGYIDEVHFDGGKADNYSLEIGSSTFVPGFEDSLIGAKVGEELDVNVTFPQEYHSPNIAGKPALFKVLVNGIKRKELPIMDDEFAKDVSEFDTFEEYKNDLRNKLQEAKNRQAKHEFEDNLLEIVANNARVDIPDVLIERCIDGIVNDFERKMRYRGLDLKQYLEITGTEYKAFREQFRERADVEVKRQLVLEKISQVENIVATEEDFEKEIDESIKNFNMSREDIEKQLTSEVREGIFTDIVTKKTVEFLTENSKVV